MRVALSGSVTMTESSSPPPQRAWLLAQGQHRAECKVSLSPAGWEVRYEVDGSVRSSKSCPTQSDMLAEVEAGEKRYKAVGWLELNASTTNAALN
jgi:hypothetical protein